ncbi:heavy metal-responsive transcriptional regulator [Nonomuraea sp. SYSU D8015]|uniref:heavy metal-responsive transcriptional regulator n=1 Tax=Nonomuraea sp. SYSU D8015 TaxID=2593644 RepID=UPI0016600DB5|nr:heavy metal-responsive transcriptional regulator [Nonomuraea sp. SYSU D8015]
MPRAGLTIGQAAQAAGLTRKAVRLYEAKGLLPPAGRSATGYRLYDEADVELLTFVRRARTLGLHLDDIAQVLAVRDSGHTPCARARQVLDRRLAEIDEAIADLLALRESLLHAHRTAANPGEGVSAVCPIIEDGIE